MAMGKSLYRAFSAEPLSCWDWETKSEIDLELGLAGLKRKVRIVSDLVEWEFSYPHLNSLLRDYLAMVKPPSAPNRLGAALGVRLPECLDDEFPPYSVGNSRWNEMFQAAVGTPLKAWAERVKAVEGTSDKFIGPGWRRTADATPPTIYPKISFGASSSQQAYIEEFEDSNGFMLWMAFDRKWIGFLFEKRANLEGSVTLPDIQINFRDELEFRFTCAVPYVFGFMSDRYTVGLDVGVRRYGTVAVWDNATGVTVERSGLSPRVEDLARSVAATTVEVSNLHERIERVIKWGDKSKVAGLQKQLEEQRRANSRKKRELAILSGQEVAEIAARWDNAMVFVEDLSWVVNTMQNGRWNRGEFVRWVSHYVELNGSRVQRVKAAGTSTRCSDCGKKVKFLDYRLVSCSCGLLLDRDDNAATNIAKRGVKQMLKSVETRRANKNYQHTIVRRSPETRRSLKHPNVVAPKVRKQDRSKNGPTRKRPKRVVSTVPREAVNLSHIGPSYLAQLSGTVLEDDCLQGSSAISVQKKLLIMYKNE